MVYCDTLAECQLLGRVEGRVEGTPGLAPDPGRGALHPAPCSHTAHGREKEQQVWVCNYED